MTAPESVSELLGLDIPAELRPYLDPADPAPRTDTPRTDAPRTDEPSEGADTRQELERELTQGMLTETEHWLGGPALQLERTVTPTGNITVGRQQIWIGGDHAGRTIGVWVDTTTIHLTYDRLGGAHVKTVPSRLTTTHLTRLRTAGAVPAGPPPVPHTAARGAPTGAVIEVDRVVSAIGLITLGARHVSVGAPLAGQRITLRFDGVVAHVLVDGVLARTIPAPVPPELRRRLRGARLAAPDQPPTPTATRPMVVQRKVSQRGTTQTCVPRNSARLEILAG